MDEKINSTHEVKVTEVFRKDTLGKPRHSLIPSEAITALAEVLTFGADKYGEHNWKKCKNTSVYLDALERHLQAWRCGERLDKESGLPHLAHALCNLTFLVYLDSKGKK